MFKVEDNVPLPVSKGNVKNGKTTLTSLLKKMKRGQSFAIPEGKLNTVRSIASSIKQTTGRVFKVSVDPKNANGYRCWYITTRHSVKKK